MLLKQVVNGFLSDAAVCRSPLPNLGGSAWKLSGCWQALKSLVFKDGLMVCKVVNVAIMIQVDSQALLREFKD